MLLRLARQELAPGYTLGRLHIDSAVFCWTLEDTVREPGVKIPGATAIPVGRYVVQVTMSPRFKQRMPILLDVPNFSGVRIHPGNSAADTEGCILVGYKALSNGRIAESRWAYQDLLNRIEDAGRAGETVHIQIDNPA